MPADPHTPTPHGLRVEFLGSGSSGNATAITDGTTTVLVDCGFSARETIRRLDRAGIDACSVSAVLITHEHTDHVRGIPVFARRSDATVWATAGCRRAARLDSEVAGVADVRTLRAGEPLRIGTLGVLPFRVSHDAVEPVGFRFESPCGTRIGIATDTGEFTPEAAEALAECDVVGLECNHDLQMLASGPYPWFLKQRIASARGHLSNPAAADALERIASARLSRVYALHLSRTNNTHELAREELAQRLARLGLDVEVDAVTQDGTPAPAVSRPR